MQIWRQVRRKGRYQPAWAEGPVLVCPVDDTAVAAAAQAPARNRKKQTVTISVNQISWTLNDTKVCWGVQKGGLGLLKA